MGFLGYSVRTMLSPWNLASLRVRRLKGDGRVFRERRFFRAELLPTRDG